MNAGSTTLHLLIGGERGIRTLGTSKGTTDFESAPFDHSGISPIINRSLFCNALHCRTTDFIRYIPAAHPSGIALQSAVSTKTTPGLQM